MIALFLMHCFSDCNFINAQEKQKDENAKFDPAQPKFALLIGVSKYKSDKLNEIPGCENNVPALAETLVKDYGFAENNIVTLVNEKATRDEIVKKFQTHLIENAKKSKDGRKEAVIVYYFCGHGSQYADHPQNKDENDGKDETFVAFDSRTGDVFDILDDEIDDLKAELSPFTTNTTLIFESCHSGTGSRGDVKLVSEEADEDTRVRPPYKRKHLTDSQTDASSYIELAASLSSNTAKSETRKFCKCNKPMSLMTRALIEGLKRANYSTTYRGLMREISAEVAKESRQEPQIEGNRDAILFYGAARRARPYIEIRRLLPDNRIAIMAGTIHGLKVGSQVSFYSSDSQTNTGNEGWLTNGIVNQVGNTASIVSIPKPEENPKVKDIKITSHVVLASPVFGGGSISLFLNRTNEMKDLSKKIEDRLKSEGLFDNRILRITSSGKISSAEKKESKGIVSLRKGKIKDIFTNPANKTVYPMSPLLDKTSENENRFIGATTCEGNNLVANGIEKRFPAMNKEVYYLDEGEPGGAPLFGRAFDPADKDVVSQIADAIRDFAYQSNLRGLDNKASDLSSKIKVSVLAVPADAIIEQCVKNQSTELWEKKYLPNEEKFKGFQEVKNNRIKLNSYFQLKIKNISGEINKKTDRFAGGEPFYISVIVLTTAGEIKVAHPGKFSVNDALLDKKEITVNLRMTEPVGIERFMIIVSKDSVDFSFYETSRGARRSPKSILEQVLTQSGTKSRDAETFTDEPGRWDIIHLELNIMDK